MAIGVLLDEQMCRDELRRVHLTRGLGDGVHITVEVRIMMMTPIDGTCSTM